MRQARCEWVGENKRITKWKYILCFQERELHFYTLELLHLQVTVSEKVILPSSYEGSRKIRNIVSHLDETKLNA